MSRRLPFSFGKGARPRPVRFALPPQAVTPPVAPGDEGPALPLAGRVAPALKLTATRQDENDGQATVVKWFRGNTPDADYGFTGGALDPAVVRMVAVKFEAPYFTKGKPTEQQKLLKTIWMQKQADRGAFKGFLDIQLMVRGGQTCLLELKRIGETLSALTLEQEAMILWAHAAGFRVGLAHATLEQVEQLLVEWEVPLMRRVPPWLYLPPDTTRRLEHNRFPLRDEALVAAIRALRAKRQERGR